MSKRFYFLAGVRVLLSISALVLFPKILYAILPSCPPGSFACQTEGGGGTPSGSIGEETPPPSDGSEGGIPSGTSPGSSSDLPSGTAPGGSETSGENANAPGAGPGSSSSAPPGVSSSDSSPENFFRNISGGGGRGSATLDQAIEEDIALGVPWGGYEGAGFSAQKPDFTQCRYFELGGIIGFDEDSDGLTQDQEIFQGTLPDNPDTDYDSFFDGEEVCSEYDPLNPPKISPVNRQLMAKLKGKILLQVERRGEAWYVYPADQLRYYLRNGAVAYSVMKFLSLGITDNDLEKIPVGHEPRFQDADSDADGLPDKTEEGLKTDPLSFDTDGDGVSDGEEVLVKKTNPLGKGKLPSDTKLLQRVRGKILLQVESRGEAWYVNPKDGKRYYMKDGNAAYQIMRFLSLGITNLDINKLPIGTLRGKIK